MRAAAILAAAVLALPGPAALACSIAPHAPSSSAERGEGCSVTWRPDEYRSVGLMPAKDLGQGFLTQTAADGNGCYAEAYAVVMDCNRGEALVVGPYMFDLMARMENPGKVSAFERVTARIEAEAKAGRPLPLDAIETEAAKAGLATRLRLATRDRVNLNGRRIPLDCGCRTFYPGLKPGK